MPWPPIRNDVTKWVREWRLD